MPLSRSIRATLTAASGRSLLVLLTVLIAGPFPAVQSRALAGAVAAPNAPQPALHDVRFGMNETASANVGDAADRAGVNWSRVTFWWSQLQKSGPSDFDLFATEHDVHINSEVERGRELVGLVLNTPGWASADGSPNGVPKNLFLPWDHPDNHWGRFMRRLAEHYRGRVDSWVIWNEVDIQHGQWRTWNGSDEEYVQLLKVAYRALKAGNPAATVVPYGAAWWYDRGGKLTRLLDLLAADPEARASNYFFDAANLHLYSRADDIPNVVAWYRGQLAARGMRKPIWIAEMNAIPYDDPIWPASKANFRATLDEQASYLVQAFATYLGLGVTRVSVNRAMDGSDFEAGGEPFGLLRNDGSTRPAYTALQVVTRHFAGAREAAYFPTDASGLTRVVLTRDGERVTVVWTMRPRPLQLVLEAVAPKAQRVTKYGQTETLDARDGVYELELAPATANSNEHDPTDFVVGGDPIILIERLPPD